MKKIIVPVDFSDVASDALDFAIDVNNLIKGKIILLHVLEIPNYSFSVVGEMNTSHPEVFFNGELIKGVHKRLEEWAQRVTDADQQVETQMLHGNPYENIAKEIVKEKADWIVMGSVGASGLTEVFVGSNAERVIRHSECPVFTIKGPTKISNMKNIVFASDLSADQDWVAYKAKEVQEMLGLNMHILKVRTPHNFVSHKVAEEQLKKFADKNHFENATLNSIEADYPDQGIVAFAEEVKAGLIITGTHGRTGLAHLFGGSRAEDLANHSKISVLTFKMPFD
ncbi:MAG: universal stress protein [Cyclobacteriaceae bacterium]